MCTLYGRSPVEVLTTLFNATVIGALSPVENEAPNRKSFQMLVNCQITVTTMIGSELGSRMRKKISKEARAVDHRSPDQLVRETPCSSCGSTKW